MTKTNQNTMGVVEFLRGIWQEIPKFIDLVVIFCVITVGLSIASLKGYFPQWALSGMTSLLSFFAIGELARRYFGEVAQHPVVSTLVYVGRFMKGMLLVAFATSVMTVPGALGGVWLVRKASEYAEQVGAQMAAAMQQGVPLSPDISTSMTAFLLFIGFIVLAGVIWNTWRLLAASATFGAGFLLQGYSIRQAVCGALATFSRHWASLLGIIGLVFLAQFAVTFVISKVSGLPFYDTLLAGGSALSIMYYVFLLSYHKRLSKLPAGC